MATLKGPCFSLKARGSLASVIVYSGNGPRHVLKRQNHRSNPNTIPQRSHRSMLRYLVASWTRLIAPARASWVNSATAEEPSPYHWYVKFNMGRWRLGKGPCWWYGNEDLGATPSMTAWGLTNHRNWIKLNWPPAGFANTLCAVWHKGPFEDFDVSPQTAIDTRWWIHIRDDLVIDKPQTLGVHYYRLQLFSSNGVGLIHPDSHSATVT